MGSTCDVNSPLLIAALEDKKVVSIAAGAGLN
jgi:hypothetical protein